MIPVLAGAELAGGAGVGAGAAAGVRRAVRRISFLVPPSSSAMEC